MAGDGVFRVLRESVGEVFVGEKINQDNRGENGYEKEENERSRHPDQNIGSGECGGCVFVRGYGDKFLFAHQGGAACNGRGGSADGGDHFHEGD